jgi:hypothetical protein
MIYGNFGSLIVLSLGDKMKKQEIISRLKLVKKHLKAGKHRLVMFHMIKIFALPYAEFSEIDFESIQTKKERKLIADIMKSHWDKW